MKSCRNCGSHELHQHDVPIQMNRKVPIHVPTPWTFNLQVCTVCGLADWFMAKKDLDWEKKKFARVG